MRVMYCAGCGSHSVIAVLHRLCVDPSMQLVARSTVMPMGCAVLGYGWVNDSEWCAGAMRFVYCAGCSWHSVFAVVNGLCADLIMQLSEWSAVLPLGQAVLSCVWVHIKHGPESCEGIMGFVFVQGAVGTLRLPL